MSGAGDVAAARARAEAARLRLMRSTQDLQHRVSPTRIANDALESAKERGNALIDGATAQAQRRPAAVAAIGLGIVAFLARHRIAGLFRRKARTKTHAIKADRHALPGPKGDRK